MKTICMGIAIIFRIANIVSLQQVANIQNIPEKSGNHNNIVEKFFLYVQFTHKNVVISFVSIKFVNE